MDGFRIGFGGGLFDGVEFSFLVFGIFSFFRRGFGFRKRRWFLFFRRIGIVFFTYTL